MQINQETFEAWLFSQDPNRFFIYADNNNCLVCNFIKETSSHKTPACGVDVYRPGGYDGAKPLPFPSFLLACLNDSLTTENGRVIVKIATMQQNYLKLYPNAFAITDGTSRGDCSHLTGDIVVVTPAHNRETQPLQQTV